MNEQLLFIDPLTALVTIYGLTVTPVSKIKLVGASDESNKAQTVSILYHKRVDRTCADIIGLIS